MLLVHLAWFLQTGAILAQNPASVEYFGPSLPELLHQAEAVPRSKGADVAVPGVYPTLATLLGLLLLHESLETESEGDSEDAEAVLQAVMQGQAWSRVVKVSREQTDPAWCKPPTGLN